MKTMSCRILLAAFVLTAGCTYKEIPAPVTVKFDCTTSTFAINQAAKSDATNCDKIDGSFTIGATGGLSPYVFSLNGGSFQADATFSNLGPGYYSVMAKDANQCVQSISVEIGNSGSSLTVDVAVIGDSNCLTGNGSISLTPSGGTPPYTFQIGTDPATSATSFTGLQAGFYQITMRDNSTPNNNGCLKTINVQVPRLNTATSFAADIQPIINTNCTLSGCHDGSTGAATNWTQLANIQKDAQNIKVRTGNRSMPLTGSLTQDQIDLIACWVDDGAKNN